MPSIVAKAVASVYLEQGVLKVVLAKGIPAIFGVSRPQIGKLFGNGLFWNTSFTPITFRRADLRWAGAHVVQ